MIWNQKKHGWVETWEVVSIQEDPSHLFLLAGLQLVTTLGSQSLEVITFRSFTFSNTSKVKSTEVSVRRDGMCALLANVH